MTVMSVKILPTSWYPSIPVSWHFCDKGAGAGVVVAEPVELKGEGS